MHLRWLTEALEELENILDQAGSRNPLEASNIAHRVERTTQNILTFPKAALYNAAGDYFERYVPKTRIILVYRIKDQEVIVIAAFHTSRDPMTKPTSRR